MNLKFHSVLSFRRKKTNKIQLVIKIFKFIKTIHSSIFSQSSDKGSRNCEVIQAIIKIVVLYLLKIIIRQKKYL